MKTKPIMILTIVFLPTALRAGFAESVCAGFNRYGNSCEARIEDDVVICHNNLEDVEDIANFDDLFNHFKGLYDNLTAAEGRESAVQKLIRKTINFINPGIQNEDLKEKSKELFAYAGTLLQLHRLKEDGSEPIMTNLICHDFFAAIQMGIIMDSLTMISSKARGVMLLMAILARAGNLIHVVATASSEDMQNVYRNATAYINKENFRELFVGAPDFPQGWGFSIAKEINYWLMARTYRHLFGEGLNEEADIIKYGVNPGLDALWYPTRLPGVNKLLTIAHQKTIKIMSEEGSSVIYNDSTSKVFRDVEILQQSFQAAGKYYGNILSLIPALASTAKRDELFEFKIVSLFSTFALDEIGSANSPGFFTYFCEGQDNETKARRATRMLFTKLEATTKWGFYFYKTTIFGKVGSKDAYSSLQSYMEEHRDIFNVDDGVINRFLYIMKAMPTFGDSKFLDKLVDFDGYMERVVMRKDDTTAYANLQKNKDDELFTSMAALICNYRKLLI